MSYLFHLMAWLLVIPMIKQEGEQEQEQAMNKLIELQGRA